MNSDTPNIKCAGSYKLQATAIQPTQTSLFSLATLATFSMLPKATAADFKMECAPQKGTNP